MSTQKKLLRYLGCLFWAIGLLAVTAPKSVALNPNCSLAQDRLDTWSVRDGLPSRTINAIVQTPDGFIWLATQEGLVRFDGNTFRIYNRQNTPELIDNSITCLFVDRSNTLWIGTNWSGFGKFVNGKYQRYSAPTTAWSVVNTISQASDGSIWAGGFGAGTLYHVVGNKAVEVPAFKDSIAGIIPLPNGGILRAEHGTGLTENDAKGVSHPYSAGGILKKYYLNCIHKASNGDLWCGTQNGLARISGGHVTFYGTHEGLASSYINCVYEDKEHRLWIGTTNGIDQWDGHRFAHFGKIDGLYDSNVNSIMEDREGNLWVGAGTALCRFAATKLIPYTFSIGQSYVGTSGYSSITQDRAGHIWCATANGLCRITQAGPAWIGGFYHRALSGVIVGPDGLLWIWWANTQHGITFTAEDPKKIIRLELPPGYSGGPTGESWNAPPQAAHIRPAKTVTVTEGVGQVFAQDGYLLAFGASKIYKISPTKLLESKNNAFQWVFACKPDNAGGGYWIGSEHGLLHLRANKAISYSADLPKNTHVLGIEASDPRCLWLATDKGLVRGIGGHFSFYGLNAGMPSTDLKEILLDGRGKIWIGSPSGIFSVDSAAFDSYDRGAIKKLPIELYQSGDGVRSSPEDCFCAIKTSDGKLWFVGKTGFTMADPGRIARNTLPPPVYILSASVDKTPLGRFGLTRVPPGEGTLHLAFAALSYVAPERVRYRYCLEGQESKWTEADDNNPVTYTYLPPGRYRFRVIACNNDGIWNNNGDTISFEIRPHYYQTFWFRLLCLAGIILAVILLARLRMEHLRKQNQALEEKVRERTAELQERTAELQIRTAELQSSYNQMQDIQTEIEAQNEELTAMQETLAQQNDQLFAANESLANLATTDGLTGLKNHRTFQEQLESDWQRYSRYQEPLSVILLDVDHFKQYNDTYGHPGGDEVLRRVAALLAEHARKSDFVARYGGEEFVIIMAQTGPEGVFHLAERLRKAIEGADWPQRGVTASFGVATAGIGTQSASDLLAAADAALYRSKQAGRNCVSGNENEAAAPPIAAAASEVA